MRTLSSPALHSVAPPSYDAAGLRTLLADAGASGATDLHFKAPGVPRFRIGGRLVKTNYPSLSPADTHRLAQTILELGGSSAALAAVTDLSVGFGVKGRGRFRADIYRQRGSLGLVVHRMALQPPRLEEMGGTATDCEVAWEQQGLTLVVGRAGRLEVLAALVDAFNHTQAAHLVALESPLEYLHRDAQASIAQREVGVDVPSFEAGLRAALVDDSDAVCATDLPDAATVELALRLAESGRPVVAGLTGCPPHQAAQFLVRLFPATREREVAARLAATLKRVVWIEDGQLQHLTIRRE